MNKICTSIEQSKKLAEILPLESSDMYWDLLSKDNYARINNIGHCLGKFCVYAWSLGALLEFLPKIVNNETLFIETSATLWHVGYRNVHTAIETYLIDACYELILKLNEQKGIQLDPNKNNKG